MSIQNQVKQIWFRNLVLFTNLFMLRIKERMWMPLSHPYHSFLTLVISSYTNILTCNSACAKSKILLKAGFKDPQINVQKPKLDITKKMVAKASITLSHHSENICLNE